MNNLPQLNADDMDKPRLRYYCHTKSQIEKRIVIARAEALRDAAKSIIDEAVKLSGRDAPDAIEPVTCNRWWWKYSQSLDSMLRAILAGEVKE